MKVSTFKKKTVATLAVTLMLAFAFMQIPNVYSAELAVQDKALTAITDVIGLDLAKYDAQITRYIAGVPSGIGASNHDELSKETVTYTLKSTQGSLDVDFDFIDKNLVSCSLYPHPGSQLPAPSTQQLTSNIIDASATILERLQAYKADASYIENMRNLLTGITEIKSMETTAANTKLKIDVVDERFTAMQWIYTSNDVDYPRTVSVYFDNGSLLGFSDTWNLYTIGSDSVKISREQAISIAREQAEKNATAISFPRGEGKYEVGKLNLTGPVVAAIRGEIREPLTAYPFWSIYLYAEESFGGVNQVQVGIWADTGEIKYCSPVGTYGVIHETKQTLSPVPSSTSSSQSNTPLPSESSSLVSPSPELTTETPKNTALPSTLPSVDIARSENDNAPISMYIIAAIAVIVISTILLLIKKRKATSPILLF